MKAILRIVIPIEALYKYEEVAGKSITIADLKCKYVADQTIGEALGSEAEWRQRIQAHVANGDVIPDQVFAEDTLVADPANNIATISYRWENKDALVTFATWRFDSEECDLPNGLSYEIIDIPDTP